MNDINKSFREVEGLEMLTKVINDLRVRVKNGETIDADILSTLRTLYRVLQEGEGNEL